DVAVLKDDLQEPDDVADALCIELDPLAQWRIGDRVLRRRLSGVSEQDCREAEWRRGELPPGALGHAVLSELLARVRPLVDGTAALRELPARSVDIAVPLPDGRLVSGTVPNVRGTRILTIDYSKLGPRARLRSWLGLVALTAG